MSSTEVSRVASGEKTKHRERSFWTLLKTPFVVKVKIVTYKMLIGLIPGRAKRSNNCLSSWKLKTIKVKEFLEAYFTLSNVKKKWNYFSMALTEYFNKWIILIW